MQRLNHHHLYIFWVFAKTESFTKTADTLLIAQSAVTSQIRNLEAVLGRNLIDRTNLRRPQITEEGKQVLAYADRIFESSRELINWATKGALPKTNVIRLGAISGLSRNLQYEFIRPRIGQINTKFEITTGDQEKLLSKLSAHELDVVLTSRNVDLSKNTGFFTNVLTTSPIVFVCNKKIATKQSFSQVLQERLLFTPGRTFEAKPELDSYLEHLDGEIQIAGEIDDIALLRIIALRSGAVVAVPKMGVANDIISKELFILRTENKIQQRFYAITKGRIKKDLDVAYLIEKMREQIN